MKHERITGSFSGINLDEAIFNAARSVITNHESDLKRRDWKRPRAVIQRAQTREQIEQDRMRGLSLAEVVSQFEDYAHIENPNWRGWRNLAGVWGRK